jgi:hypothetical protein
MFAMGNCRTYLSNQLLHDIFLGKSDFQGMVVHFHIIRTLQGISRMIHGLELHEGQSFTHSRRMISNDVSILHDGELSEERHDLFFGQKWTETANNKESTGSTASNHLRQNKKNENKLK